MNHRYWKADKETSKKILDYLEEYTDIKKRAYIMSRKIKGASRSCIYTSSMGSSFRVDGFVIKDESKVDKKVLCRVKNTTDGWRPRANTKLYAEFRKLQSCAMDRVMELIGMELFRATPDGLVWRTPGIMDVDGTVYLKTTADCPGHGCKRITDIEYERATTRND